MFDSKRFLVYRLEDSITTTIIDSFSYQKAIIFNWNFSLRSSSL